MWLAQPRHRHALRGRHAAQEARGLACHRQDLACRQDLGYCRQGLGRARRGELIGQTPTVRWAGALLPARRAIRGRR